MSDRDMRGVVERIDALVRRFAEAPEPAVRRDGEALARSLTQLYGEGLTRIVKILELEERRTGPLLPALAADDLVASLLVLHDLHPNDAPTRVERALERLAADAGARLTLIEIRDATAVVRVEGASPSAFDRGALIEQVVRAAAPDVAAVEIMGLPPAPAPALVQLRRGPAPREVSTS